jgi:hypothetical protein
MRFEFPKHSFFTLKLSFTLASLTFTLCQDQALHLYLEAIATGCPTRYRTHHFFNHFTTNEDNATKFEADLPHCVRNVKEKDALLFKFLCNIFIGVTIIKEMPGLVASGTPCTYK